MNNSKLLYNTRMNVLLGKNQIINSLYQIVGN